LCYLTLLEVDPFLRFLPSEIAISSIILAAHSFGVQHLLDDEFYKRSVAFESKKDNGDINNLLHDRQLCVDGMHKLQMCAADHPQQSIFLKFSKDKLYTISLMDPAPEIPQVI